MFRRAKICVLLVTAGAITMSAASLDVSDKNPVFSTDQQTSTPVVIKPSKTKAKLGPSSRWRKAKVQKITPTAQSANGVEINGFIFSKPANAPIPSIAPAPVAPEKK